jgi:hypothetical protein
MKVKELMKVLGNEVVCTVDIKSNPIVEGKPIAFPFTKHTSNTCNYKSRSLEEYTICSIGTFPCSNFDFVGLVFRHDIHEKMQGQVEILVIDIDGKEFDSCDNLTIEELNESVNVKNAVEYISSIRANAWKKAKQKLLREIAIGINVPVDVISNTLEPNKINKNIPTKVIFNEKKRATTLMFGNQPTVVKASEGTTYDKRIGFLEAYFQARSGLSKTKALKYLDKLVEEKEVKE